tara:strand:+ start:7009 stop:8955 length:1947 start_codon:yes stop_codon:yes gene_type:complete
MIYKPHIDGLRCIAILSVVFYHMEFLYFEGGYIGVDIFFVISGYLITLIIDEEFYKTNNFLFKVFYIRRAKRIFPSLIVVCIITFPAAAFILIHTDFVNYSKSVISSLTFISNFYFLHENLNYFGNNSILVPFLHTWSLSIEIQFYIFFPIVYYLTLKYFNDLKFFLLIFLTIIFFSLTEYLSHKSNSIIFFSPFTRIWEFLIGSSLVHLEKKKFVRDVRYSNLSTLLCCIGLFLITIFIIYFDDSVRHPSFFTLIPLVGTCFIILFVNLNSMIGKLISFRLFTGVGLISYSLYLVHFPILSLKNQFYSNIIIHNSIINFLLLFLIFVISFFSWKLVEKPFREKKHNKIILIIFLFVLSLNFSVIYFKGYPNIKYNNEQFNSIDLKKIKSSSKRYLGIENSPPEFILLGDSHANSFQDSFEKILKEKNKSALVGTINGCPPAINLFRHDLKYNQRCTVTNLKAIDIIKNNPSLKKAIISARWPLYLDSNRFNNEEGCIEIGSTKKVIFDHVKYKDNLRKPKLRQKEIHNQILNYIDLIKEQGLEIIIIDNIPEVGCDVRKWTAFNFKKDLKLETRFDVYKKRSNSTRNLLINLKKQYNIINTSDTFCKNKTNKCITSQNNQLLYWDSNHLTNHGAELLLNQNKNIIFK